MIWSFVGQNCEAEASFLLVALWWPDPSGLESGEAVVRRVEGLGGVLRIGESSSGGIGGCFTESGLGMGASKWRGVA